MHTRMSHGYKIKSILTINFRTCKQRSFEDLINRNCNILKGTVDFVELIIIIIGSVEGIIIMDFYLHPREFSEISQKLKL